VWYQNACRSSGGGVSGSRTRFDGGVSWKPPDGSDGCWRVKYARGVVGGYVEGVAWKRPKRPARPRRLVSSNGLRPSPASHQPSPSGRTGWKPPRSGAEMREAVEDYPHSLLVLLELCAATMTV